MPITYVCKARTCPFDIGQRPRAARLRYPAVRLLLPPRALPATAATGELLRKLRRQAKTAKASAVCYSRQKRHVAQTPQPGGRSCVPPEPVHERSGRSFVAGGRRWRLGKK